MKRLGALAGASVLAASITAAPATAQTNLVYANGYAKTHVQVGVIGDEWIERIDKATNGQVKIRHVPGGALIKPEQMLEGIRGATADIGSFVVSFFPGQLPIAAALGSTVDLELGNKLDMKGVTALTARLADEFEAFNKEFANLGVRPVYWVPTPAYGIISTKPIKTLADFNSVKVRAFGNNIPKLLDAAGAVPVAMAFGEIYTSLQTGVIGAALTDPPAMLTGKFQEVAKNVVLTGPQQGALTAIAPVVYAFNAESWKKLSADHQKAIMKVGVDMSQHGAGVMIDTNAKALSDLKAAGVTITNLPQADVDALSKKAPDFFKLAADSLNEKGIQGTALVARYKELAQAYLNGSWKPF